MTNIGEVYYASENDPAHEEDMRQLRKEQLSADCGDEPCSEDYYDEVDNYEYIDNYDYDKYN